MEVRFGLTQLFHYMNYVDSQSQYNLVLVLHLLLTNYYTRIKYNASAFIVLLISVKTDDDNEPQTDEEVYKWNCEDLEKNTRETIHYMTVLGKRWENEGGNQHEQVMHNKDIGNISLEEVSFCWSKQYNYYWMISRFLSFSRPGKLFKGQQTW